MLKQDHPTGWMWIHACEVIVKAERLQRQFFQPMRRNARWPYGNRPSMSSRMRARS